MTKLLITISFILFLGSPFANANKQSFARGYSKCSTLLKYERDREYDRESVIEREREYDRESVIDRERVRTSQSLKDGTSCTLRQVKR